MLYLAAVFRSSRPEMFCKKGVHRNFAKFKGTHLCQSLLFNKVFGPRPSTLCKKETQAQVFSCEFCVILRTPFSKNPPVAASPSCFMVFNILKNNQCHLHYESFYNIFILHLKYNRRTSITFFWHLHCYYWTSILIFGLILKALFIGIVLYLLALKEAVQEKF